MAASAGEYKLDSVKLAIQSLKYAIDDIGAGLPADTKEAFEAIEKAYRENNIASKSYFVGRISTTKTRVFGLFASYEDGPITDERNKDHLVSTIRIKKEDILFTKSTAPNQKKIEISGTALKKIIEEDEKKFNELLEQFKNSPEKVIEKAITLFNTSEPMWSQHDRMRLGAGGAGLQTSNPNKFILPFIENKEAQELIRNSGIMEISAKDIKIEKDNVIIALTLPYGKVGEAKESNKITAKVPLANFLFFAKLQMDKLSSIKSPTSERSATNEGPGPGP